MNCFKSKEGTYPKFVIKSCWMRGLFLYKELMAEPRQSREFRIPDDIFGDHIQNNCLVSRCTRVRCRKMTKVYFSLYQWVPFLFLRFSFFLPMLYLVFRQGLRRNLKLQIALRETFTSCSLARAIATGLSCIGVLV